MKKYILATLLLTVLLIWNLELEAQEQMKQEEPVATYIGENGIQIISYSSAWKTQEKLKSVYLELLKNEHGDEISYLSKIYIYSGLSGNEAGNYYHDYYIEKAGKYKYKSDRYIEIYNGDKYTQLSQIARTLSHEYGHHFSFYYLITKENKTNNKWSESKYAKIRKLSNDSRLTYLGDTTKKYSHEWDIAEIIADDYVQLYGSELARKSRDYYDIKERIHNNSVTYSYYYSDFNLLPQENLDIPLAADVRGIVDYFYTLSGVKVRSVPESITVSQPQLTDIKSVYNNYNEYIFEWKNVKQNELKKQYEYTLIINAKDSNDYPVPIKTVYSGEPMYAVAGSSIDIDKGRSFLFNYEGEYEIRLFVKDKNGFMHGSTLNKLSISPKDNSKIIFSDVQDDHWAIDYIYELRNKDMVSGYENNTFRPEESISRAEFMSFLVRGLKEVEVKQVANGSHWFIKQGYRDAAYLLGLIKTKSLTASYYDGNISRQEMVQMIYNLLKRQGLKVNLNYTTKLKDIRNNDYEKEISVVTYYGIISGYPDRTFKPENNASRAEAMKIISEFLSKLGI